MNIILFGFKASGKTYLGEKLAKHLQRPFIDTDRLILQCHPSSSIQEIYQTLGEKKFRAIEQEIILSLSAKESVIALGGGSVTQKKAVLKLQNIGKLVYLNTSFETIKKRIFEMGKIPAFIDPLKPISSLFKIYQERICVYEKISALKIDTDQYTTQQILEMIKHGI